ncbi:CHASE3 domain-containing protein [Polaribacter cellanae]|uniref:histidine kinase n=1 Tax=Polaribacter cellanae TaxID=2818493 RepID=A0A975CKK3_9FLAO|nr:CHASE3 domain-containing protein [Polaribacter cellanae]QTE21438.1 CHASE3 domain-containing protein [Polaribacter cellanae]
MKRTILKSERFLKAIFGASLFVILCIGGFAYQHIQKLVMSFEMVEHTYEVNVELEQILSYLKDAETGQRGYLITKDTLYLQPYYASRENANNSFARLKELTIDDKEQQNNLKNLSFLIGENLSIFDKSLKYADKNGTNTAGFYALLKNGKQTMDNIRAAISKMISHQNELLQIRKKKSNESLTNTPLVIYSVLIITLVLLLLTYAKINKDLKILKEKNIQLEIFKESTNQSEIVSKHGNWTYYINENRFEYSDNLYRLLGEQPQSFPSTIESFMEFVHPEDLENLQKQVDKMIKEENLPFIYYRIVQKNGNIRHFKAYGKIIVSNDDQKRLLGITSDITEEVENYRLLEERNLELERNNKELSSFNHVASHDLQEPLRKIQTFISRLDDKEADNLSEKGTLYLKRIKTAASRMRLLIDDLLQFSRTNKSEEVLEATNMNLILENAKQELAETILDKKAKITSDAIPVMTVIPFQAQQLFINLIGNSLKYSKKELAPTINISYCKVAADDVPKLKKPKYSNYHKLTFVDNGIGFNQEFAEKIFVLFSRLHNKNEYSGTGIGLSICKKIVDNHQGYIFAKGKLNKGAIFEVFLPFK